MSYTTTNTVKLAIAPVENGVIDNTKARYIRVISDDLGENKDTDNSEELVDTNTVRGILTTGIDTAGTINFEFSYGSFDDLLTTFLRNDWVDNEDGTETLTNGVIDKEFVIEKKVGNFYYTFYGMKGNELSITKAVRSKITGSMSFIGTHAEFNTTSVFDGVEIAETSTTRVMTNYTNLKQHEGLAKITSFDYTIANNAAPRENVFATDDVAQRLFQLTGNGTAFFIDDALYRQFKDEQVIPFGIKLDHSEDEYYIFSFKHPHITSISGLGGAGGTNTDVFNDFSFECTSESGPVIEITKGKVVSIP